MPKNKEVALIIVLLDADNCYISLCGRGRVGSWRTLLCLNMVAGKIFQQRVMQTTDYKAGNWLQVSQYQYVTEAYKISILGCKI